MPTSVSLYGTVLMLIPPPSNKNPPPTFLEDFRKNKNPCPLFWSSDFQKNKNPSNRREAPEKIVGSFWH